MIPSLRHRLRCVPLVLSAALGLGCSKAVVIAEYPVDRERVAAGIPSHADPGEGYWSAYVRIENQDIPYLWKTNDLDYALISIEVTIPTRKGPLVRTIPLFTLEHGVPQAESGVDLLKKIPLTREAREQVAFRLKVTYLKNKEALETSRKILDRVANLAKPFLANYPMASQIIETSLGLIDDSVESRSTTASSMVTVVDVDSVVQQAARSSDGSSMVQAYFLIPMNLRLNRGGGKNHVATTSSTDPCRESGAVEYCGVKPWLEKQIGKDKRIVECSDLRGRLCLVSENDDADLERLIADKVTRLGERIDGQLQRAGRDLAPMKDTIALSELVEWVIIEEDRPLSYEDVPKDAIDRLQPFVIKLNEFVTQHGRCFFDETETKSKSETETEAETSCADVYESYGAALDRFRPLIRMTLDETEELLGLRQALEKDTVAERRKYRESRLDSVVYVTVRFERYDEVYDPLALIPGSRKDCGAITESAIESAQEYFGANVDFFREKDADKIRQLLRGSREYLLIKDLVEKGSYIEAARALGQADALHRIRRQMSASASIGQDTLLDSHVLSIATCFEELEQRPPLRQLSNLWNLYLGEQGMSAASGPWRIPKQCTDQEQSARRFDLIALALGEFTRAIGDEETVVFREDGSVLGAKSRDIEVAELLFEEGKEIHQQQLNRLKALPKGDCKKAVEQLEYFSAACVTCFTQIETTCKDDNDKLIEVYKAQENTQTCARSALAP